VFLQQLCTSIKATFHFFDKIEEIDLAAAIIDENLETLAIGNEGFNFFDFLAIGEGIK